MFKKSLLSVTCFTALLAAVPASASTFHLVVPLLARASAPGPGTDTPPPVPDPEPEITVSLAGAALPKATVNQTYTHSLQDHLAVTGDSSLDKSAARWRLAEGTLPTGLVLNATTGAVFGTPTAKTPSPVSFTVLATYKGSEGQAVYTIEVGGLVLNVSKIAAGQFHTCAITESGGVKCWGRNNHGQVGDNSTTTRLTPVNVVGLSSGVASITAGASYTCAVMTSGAAKCWGLNNFGQLGDSSTTKRLTPVNVTGLASGVASLSAGNYHTCATLTSGTAKCWGANDTGQLGDNSTTQRNAPVDVIGLGSDVARIQAGTSHTCAVTTSGAAKCWGGNTYGQVGDNSTTQRNTPVDVVGLTSGVANIVTGNAHTCAVTTSGAAKCWGFNVYGQLGNNTTTHRSAPVDVVGLGSGVASLAAGSHHTCAVTFSGAAKCWGWNVNGQLGDNSTTQRNTPRDVVGMESGVASLDAGDQHTCASMTSSAAKCWGYNSYGQLGDNTTTTQRLTPIDVFGFQ